MIIYHRSTVNRALKKNRADPLPWSFNDCYGNFSLTLLCNGEIRATGRGSNVLGSPLVVLAHLIDVLSKHRNPCRSRQLKP